MKYKKENKQKRIITKRSFILSLVEELIPIISAKKLHADKVYVQEQQKKIENNILSKQEAKKILKLRAAKNNLKCCKNLQKKRKQYHTPSK